MIAKIESSRITRVIIWLNQIIYIFKNSWTEGFPYGLVVKNLPAYAGDMGSIPGPGQLGPCAIIRRPFA